MIIKVILKYIVKRIKKINAKIKLKKYIKQCKKNNRREFYLFNTPIHGNLGDHAIALAEIKMLEKCGIKPFEIPTHVSDLYFDFIEKNISSDAVIGITGGGFIGSQWMKEENLVMKVAKTFRNQKLVIFPQTIYFRDDENGKSQLQKSIEIFDNVKEIHIFTREKQTYDFTKQTYLNARISLVPDIVLSMDTFETNNTRKNVLLCFRNDVEKTLSEDNIEVLNDVLKRINCGCDTTDTVEKEWISIKNREKYVYSKLNEFSKYKLVITDRLHGMIFATITNTPCIVFGNYNYKVEGVFQWIKDIDSNIIFKYNMRGIEDDIKRMLNKKIDKRTNKNNYTEKFKVLYNILEDING